MDWVNTESWPVCGLTKPILMVPPEAEPPALAVDVEVCLSALEQPASPPAAAMPAAPRKPRLLRKPLLWSVTGSLSVRPAAAVLHYRAHPLTIRASARKLVSHA